MTIPNSSTQAVIAANTAKKYFGGDWATESVTDVEFLDEPEFIEVDADAVFVVSDRAEPANFERSSSSRIYTSVVPAALLSLYASGSLTLHGVPEVERANSSWVQVREFLG